MVADRLCRADAAVKNLTHSASLAAWWFTVPPHFGIKRLTDLPQQRTRLFMVALPISHFRSGRFLSPEKAKEMGKI